MQPRQRNAFFVLPALLALLASGSVLAACDSDGDDTDRQRNVDLALQPILEGFRWLGLDWDEGPDVGGDFGPYFQSQREDLYRDAVEKLLANGFAYRDYATQEELTEERERAQAAGEKFIYSRRWMAETDEDAQQFTAEGRQAVVRLKIPREGSCRFHDLVRGDMELAWDREQDGMVTERGEPA